jgi:2-hydroxychromene-2-carboxylate isomerase
MWRDLERLCADLDVPFRRPDPFPQNSLLAACVALIALDQGLGEAFCVALFRAQFGDGRRIDDDGVLDDILVTLQVDPPPVLAAARSDANKTRLRAQTEEAQRLGLFGAPSFTTEDGELFWGNDRLETAVQWAGGQRVRTRESSE